MYNQEQMEEIQSEMIVGVLGFHVMYSSYQSRGRVINLNIERNLTTSCCLRENSQEAAILWDKMPPVHLSRLEYILNTASHRFDKASTEQVG